MRVLLCVMLLAAVAMTTGCWTFPNSPILAPLTLDQGGSVAGFSSDVQATSTGTATAQGVILYGWGDASILAAAANGNITRIRHVDSESLNVFGIYSRYTTIVYGE